MGYGNPFSSNPYIERGQQGNQSYHYPERIIPPANQTLVPSGHDYYQPPVMSSQDRYDSRNCQMNLVRYSMGGMAGGAAGVGAFGVKYCPKSPIYPACVTGAALGGATFGAFAGGVQGLQTPACQSITRTVVDKGGNGHIYYGSGS